MYGRDLRDKKGCAGWRRVENNNSECFMCWRKLAASTPNGEK